MPAKNLYRERKEGIYSHIYNKGVEKRTIFNDEEDYEVFKSYLRGYLTPPQDPKSIKKSFTVNGHIFRGTPHQPKNYFGKVELMAYVLMPGHFHLLLYQVTKGSLESFIRSLCTRYSMYFNKKYKRTGALFEGPYKSVQIENGPRLPHLTRFFHQTGGHSSYAEYLGTKETSWVKPGVVLSFFSKGTVGYKEFVEGYRPDQKIKELLEGITFESEAQHLERRDPTRNLENILPEIPKQPFGKIGLERNLKPLQRMPEILATTVVFCLLLIFGIRNIMVTEAGNSNSSTVTAVLSTAEKNPGPSATPIVPLVAPENSISPTPSATPAATKKTKPKMVTVKVSDGAESVNIRQKPTTNSEKIGIAKDGDTFEYLSESLNWYEVKLATRSGFISAKYITVNGRTNE